MEVYEEKKKQQIFLAHSLQTHFRKKLLTSSNEAEVVHNYYHTIIFVALAEPRSTYPNSYSNNVKPSSNVTEILI